MKAIVAAFNHEKALVGAFSVITNLRMELFEALTETDLSSVMSSQATVGRVRVAGPQSMLGLGTITVTDSGRGAVLGRL